MRKSILIVVVLCFPPTSIAAEKPYGLKKRVPLTTSRVVGYPEPLPPFRATRIYQNIKFTQPLHVIKEPTSDRLLVTERYGDIYAITHDRSAKKAELFYETNRVAYSLCFHPNYTKNGYLYVFTNHEKQNRISRYTVDKPTTGKGKIKPKSEKTIIQWKSAGHDGHYVRFGPDGMLWISAGDGTVGMDPELDGQDISNLRGTMIRIDVDRPANGKPYSIPKDNPFRNLKLPPKKKGGPGRVARPEVWAFGFRNPYRFTFDPKNNALWVADIGQDVWEMLYLVKKAGNYGWSVMEGPEPLNATRAKGPGPFQKPVISHPHSEMRSITGGYFYHGRKFPELRGAYLYGDYDTRRLWAMRYDYAKRKVTFQKQIARTKYRIISIDPDRDGEPIITAFGGELFELERQPKTAKPKFPFPRKLSDSGLFASVKDHKMAAGVIPYSVNSPLWSDGAVKHRYIAVPGEQKVTYKDSRAWGFPEGTVLIKTFSLPTDKADGLHPVGQRIETRFLTLHDNGEWAGYSYRWNAEQTDAYLVDARGAETTFRDKQGKTIKRWRFPSRTECMVCHTREARYVLGVTTLQMNRAHNYAGVEDNQLRALQHIGFFKPATGANKFRDGKNPVGKLAKIPKLPDPFDKSQPLDARARSYLHANCWHCHVVNGGGNAEMELHFSKSKKDAKIYDVKPRHMTYGINNPRLVAPGSPQRSLVLHRITTRGKGKMPPVASFEVDHKAARLLKSWIEQLREMQQNKK